jgi:hypothetical protein
MKFYFYDAGVLVGAIPCGCPHDMDSMRVQMFEKSLK